MKDREHQNKEADKKVIEFDRLHSGSESPESPESDDPLARASEVADASVLAERAARLQAEKDELTQTLVRRQADFENYRKRIEREREDDRRSGVRRLIEDLLPVLDAFSRAVKAHDDPAYQEYRKGLELIHRQLWDILARSGLERIPAEGKPFDPHYHQAIERVESSEHPEGTVVDVLQDGFLLHERVIRPSMVRVSYAASHSDGGKSAAQRHSK
jgi:molecular chaperone GrpE